MRLLISNPDTLGDLVLRQPLIAALTEAGHELMLIVRPSVEAMVRQIAPAAQIVTLPAEPYALDTEGPWEPFEDLFARARTFAPAALVVAPFRWTLFEEQLAVRLPEVPRVGMSGNLYRGDPYAGVPAPSTLTFDQIAHVTEDDREITKNAALAATLIGRPIGPIDPVITVPAEGMETAQQLLGEVGFIAGQYWTACLGGTAHVTIKTWPTERWAAALSHWAQRYGRKFLFIGLPEEQPAVDAVREAMGEQASATAVMMRPGIPLAALQGLIGLSSGYVGHDTGPMHLAAALRKPVLGVFGQGTWPRFVPAVDPSVALCVGVPCAGCGWICTFDQSYCIKAVPVERVTGAIDDLEAGRVNGREMRVVEMPPALLARLTRESAQVAEARLREAAEARKQLAIVQAQLAETQHREAAVAPSADAATEATLEPMTQTAPPAVSVAEGNTGGEETGGETGRNACPTEEGAGQAPAEIATVAEIASPAVPAIDPAALADLIAQQAAPLREQVAALETRLRAMQEELDKRAALGVSPPPPLPPTPPQPRRPLRAVMIDLAIGRQHLPPPPHKAFIPVSVVVPATGDLEAVRASVMSALDQEYPNREVLVVDDLRSADVSAFVESLGDRVRSLKSRDGSMFQLIEQGFEQSYGQVLGFLRPGVTYSAGTLLTAAELFRDNRGANAAYFETISADGAWRFSAGPGRQIDLVDLLDAEPLVYESIFWRRGAYQMLNGLNTGRGAAADWDLTARATRMFGLFRGDGSAAIVPLGGIAPDPARATDLAGARQIFNDRFGAVGRARCDVIHRVNAVGNKVDAQVGPGRLTFPPPAGPLSPVPLSDGGAAVPVCPLTKRPADRLLFSDFSRDRVRTFYLATASRLVLSQDTASGAASADAQPSLYTGHAIKGRWLIDKKPPVHAGPLITTPQPVQTLAMASDAHAAVQSARSLIDLSCGDGAVLTAFGRDKGRTSLGLTTDAAHAAAARAAGHEVIEADAFDAPFVVPDGGTFDVVFVGRALNQTTDPLALLRRAKNLLNPGGVILLTADNLNSLLIELFGPTWAGWDGNRSLVTPASLKRLATAASLRVLMMRSQTPAVRAAQSLVRNRTGLTPPTDEIGTDDLAIGQRIAGWAKLLYDRRGRGDVIHAVLGSV
ncbi:MAG TPA: glycosyltransferase family 9 protein [Tepidisphaeraceae bacterium]|jgi:ADP-heptose:LPS heptosyltransferase/SAM-dependent methyltransferase|nr:glycosyltransferase family 9 protein [Tepidisphaeraceae bacterium]